MTLKIETLHRQFLNDFESIYFHDEAKNKILNLAVSLEGGIVPTAANATGVRSFGMFANKTQAPTDAPNADKDSKKDFGNNKI